MHHEETTCCGCHGQQEGCCCEHDHDGCGCGCEHEQNEGKVLLVGGVLFAAGILVSVLGAGLVGNLLHIAAYALLGLPVLKTAGKNLLKGHVFDENFLMSIATLGAFVIG